MVAGREVGVATVPPLSSLDPPQAVRARQVARTRLVKPRVRLDRIESRSVVCSSRASKASVYIRDERLSAHALYIL